ncbi:MAG: Rpn family recombination-promoting nuclease/putative transposase [Ardenticatenaceae bacterium]|nr:Rpn family recombination-promoting nuclease/putative transposase [Ardenticatenaceae bacterium]
MLALLDLDSLTLQEGSFIDEEMQAHQTDLLYQVQLREGGTASIYLLFEHKSYPDPLVALQLLRYMVNQWQQQVKDKAALTPVIPLVIYHGERAWKVDSEFAALLDVPAVLRPFQPNFRYHLSDFSHLSDETIRGEIWLRVSLSVLRAIFDPHLRHQLRDLVRLLFQLSNQQTGLEYIHTILYYLSDATDKLTRAELGQAIRQQGREGEQVMATIRQEYVQEGMQLGLEQGRIEALQNSILDLLDIRFEEVDEEVEEEITAVTHIPLLRQLNREAATAVSMIAFVEKLAELNKTD